MLRLSSGSSNLLLCVVYFRLVGGESAVEVDRITPTVEPLTAAIKQHFYF